MGKSDEGRAAIRGAVQGALGGEDASVGAEFDVDVNVDRGRVGVDLRLPAFAFEGRPFPPVQGCGCTGATESDCPGPRDRDVPEGGTCGCGCHKLEARLSRRGGGTRKRLVLRPRPELGAAAEDLRRLVLALTDPGLPQIGAPLSEQRASMLLRALGEVVIEDDPDEEVGILVTVKRGEREIASSVIASALPAHRQRLVGPEAAARHDAYHEASRRAWNVLGDAGALLERARELLDGQDVWNGSDVRPAVFDELLGRMREAQAKFRDLEEP